MDLEDQFRILVSGYYGIQEMDEYELKVYVLKQIEDYLIEFIQENPMTNFHYREEASSLESTLSLKEKLQGSLSVLHMINAPLELYLLVRNRLKQLES